MALTTQEDVELRLSEEGVFLRSDDNRTSIDDCIEEGYAIIVSYLQPQFPDTSSYAAVPILRFMNRAFAVYFLCQRRNETPTETIQKEFERYMKVLEDYATGKVKLFGPTPSLGGPGVSNQFVDPHANPIMGVDVARSQDVHNPAARQLRYGPTHLPKRP